MKKRIMLIVAFGVSFTPAVFAESTGQMSFHKMTNTETSVGIACTRDRDKKLAGSNDSEVVFKKSKANAERGE
jgi:hypothetical protein